VPKTENINVALKSVCSERKVVRCRYRIVRCRRLFFHIFAFVFIFEDVLPNIDRTYKTRSVCTPVTHHHTAATEWCPLLLDDVICSVRRTSYNALSMGMTQQFSRFCPWWPWPLTLTFQLIRARTKHIFPVNLAQTV